VPPSLLARAPLISPSGAAPRPFAALARRGRRRYAAVDRLFPNVLRGESDILGEYFVTSFLAYKRNEIERFERFVTDWEFREYAYHL
jgi:glutamine synthetase